MKIGKTRVSKQLVHGEYDGFAAIRELMHVIVVIHAVEDWKFGYPDILYTCYCDDFDNINEGEIIPEYIFSISDKAPIKAQKIK